MDIELLVNLDHHLFILVNLIDWPIITIIIYPDFLRGELPYLMLHL